MAIVVARSDLISTSTLTCVPRLGPKGTIVNLVSTSILTLNRTNQIGIQLGALGLTWDRYATYTIRVNPGLTTDSQGLNNSAQSIPFFTSNGPVQTSLNLGPTTTGSFYNNTYFTFGFDRTIYVGDSGATLKLYKSNGPYASDAHDGTLIKSWTSSQINIGFSSPQSFTVIIAGLLLANSNYYWTYDDGLVKDIDGIKVIGVPATSGSYQDIDIFSTASQPYFKDLSASLTSSSTVYARPSAMLKQFAQANLVSTFTLASDVSVISGVNRWLSSTSAANYVEDTPTLITGAPQVLDTLSPANTQYYIQIIATPNYPGNGVIRNLTIDPVAPYGQYTTGGSTLLMNGTITQINNMLSHIKITGAPDQTSPINITYQIGTTSGQYFFSRTQGLTITSPFDNEVTGFPSGISYLGKQSNSVFPSNLITDFDGTYNSVTYTVTVSSNQVGASFASDPYGSDSANPITITGNISTVNNALASLKFYPANFANTNTTITYTQSKSDLSGTQYTNSFTMSYGGNSTRFTEYSIASNRSWIPTLEEQFYCVMNYTLVGPGGDGAMPSSGTPSGQAGAGGSGGVVLNRSSQSIDPGGYFITIGTGGSGNSTQMQANNSGSIIASASAGNNGFISDGNVATNGVSSSGFAGGLGFWSGSVSKSFTPVFGGSAGAGGAGQNAQYTSNYISGAGGNGVAGLDGQIYGYGGYGGNAVQQGNLTYPTDLNTTAGSGGHGGSISQNSLYIKQATNGHDGLVYIKTHR
jgi:hypothetical protein